MSATTTSSVLSSDAADWLPSHMMMLIENCREKKGL